LKYGSGGGGGSGGAGDDQLWVQQQKEFLGKAKYIVILRKDTLWSGCSILILYRTPEPDI